jgi:hypothetical protein
MLGYKLTDIGGSLHACASAHTEGSRQLAHATALGFSKAYDAKKISAPVETERQRSFLCDKMRN